MVDPIFSLRCRVTLAPRDRQTIIFVTLAAGSRDEVLALASRYRRDAAITQAFELMWTRSQLQFRYLHIGTEHAHRFQEIASYLLYPNPRLRPSDRIARNHLGQSGLWAFGISGDLPILNCRDADPTVDVHQLDLRACQAGLADDAKEVRYLVGAHKRCARRALFPRRRSMETNRRYRHTRNRSDTFQFRFPAPTARRRPLALRHAPGRYATGRPNAGPARPRLTSKTRSQSPRLAA